MPPRYEKGDIWTYKESHYIGIPCNIGWNSEGLGIMGAGLALQAAERYPQLRRLWGDYCSLRTSDNVEPGVLILAQLRLLLIPTKPMAMDAKGRDLPSQSWKGRSTLPLIEQSLLDIIEYAQDEDTDPTLQFALPWLGCGLGGLTRNQVKPLFDKYLDSNYIIVG